MLCVIYIRCGDRSEASERQRLVHVCSLPPCTEFLQLLIDGDNIHQRYYICTILLSSHITMHHQLDVRLRIHCCSSLLRKDATARFDGFLVSIAGVGNLMVGAASTNASSLSSPASSEGDWGDWRVESDPALVTVIRKALNDAATSAIDQMEEEIVTAARRGEVHRHSSATTTTLNRLRPESSLLL